MRREKADGGFEQERSMFSLVSATPPELCFGTKEQSKERLPWDGPNESGLKVHVLLRFFSCQNVNLVHVYPQPIPPWLSRLSRGAWCAPSREVVQPIVCSPFVAMLSTSGFKICHTFRSSELPLGLSLLLTSPAGGGGELLAVLSPSRCHRLSCASLRSVPFWFPSCDSAGNPCKPQLQVKWNNCSERPGINPEPPVTSSLSRVFAPHGCEAAMPAVTPAVICAVSCMDCVTGRVFSTASRAFATDDLSPQPCEHCLQFGSSLYDKPRLVPIIKMAWMPSSLQMEGGHLCLADRCKFPRPGAFRFRREFRPIVILQLVFSHLFHLQYRGNTAHLVWGSAVVFFVGLFGSGFVLVFLLGVSVWLSWVVFPHMQCFLSFNDDLGAPPTWRPHSCEKPQHARG